MPPDRDLDMELRDLGPRIEYPPVPDLARSVRGRLEAEVGSAGSPSRTRPQVWWIAAAALILLVAVPVVSLAVRGTGDGALSGAGGGAVVESGGQEAGDAGPTRMVEEDEPLAAGAGGGSSSMAAESGRAPAGTMTDACMPPEPILETEPSRGAPGAGFGVRGENFDADSRDCNNDPARNVRLQFLQDGRAWDLGSVDASPRGSRLAAELKVPNEARPGRATVRATYDQRAPRDLPGRASAEARFFVTG